MEYGSMLGESFAYAKDAVTGTWKRWPLLFVATLLLNLPLFGYILKIYRGEKPAPEVTGWGTLFVDGIRYIIVVLIYALPAIILFMVTLGAVILEILKGNTANATGLMGGLIFGLVIVIVVGLICSLFSIMGVIRLARTGSIGEAFNFAVIRATIGRIGWINYIIAVILLDILMTIYVLIIFGIDLLTGVSLIGTILSLVLTAPVSIFGARYLCQVYDAAGPA